MILTVYGAIPWKGIGIVILIWVWAISRIIYLAPMLEPDQKTEVEYKKRRFGAVRGFVANVWDWTH